MKVIVIPVDINDKPYIANVCGDNSNTLLQSYYSIIDCRLIDIITLDEGEDDALSVDAIIDDEGELDCKPINQWFLLSGNLIAGVVIINMIDENTGECVELDIERVKRLLIAEYGFTKQDLELLAGE